VKGIWERNRGLLRRFRDWLTGRRPEPTVRQASPAQQSVGIAPAPPKRRRLPNPGYDSSGITLGTTRAIDPPGALDPNFCLVVSLFEALDFEQLFLRTGIRVGSDGKVRKPKTTAVSRVEGAERCRAQYATQPAQEAIGQGVNLRVGAGYFDEVANTPSSGTSLDSWCWMTPKFPVYPRRLRGRVA